MNISVPVTPAIEQRLRERAAAAGKDLASYAAEVIARDATRPSLDEILRPVREDFAKSGLSEEQLMDLGRRAVDSARKNGAA